MNSITHKISYASSPRRVISFHIFTAILRRFLIIFALCLAAFLALFLIAAMIDDLPDFITHGAGYRDMGNYFMLLQPEQLTHVIPIALLLSAMYLFSDLSRNQELTALRAAGLSLWQISSPLWAAGMVISILYFINSEFAAPTCHGMAVNLLQAIKDPYKIRTKSFKPYLAYRNKAGRRDWYFEKFNPSGISSGINITQFRPNRTVAWELVAAAASYTESGWQFTQAVMRRFDDDGYLMIDEPIRQATLTLPDLNEYPRSFSYMYSLKPMEDLSALRIQQLLTEEDMVLPEKTRINLTTYWYYYLLRPLSCLLALVLGIPLAVVTARGNALVNFLLALALFSSYYLVTQFFLVAGKSQWLSALIANVIPLAGYGLWGLRRMWALR